MAGREIEALTIEAYCWIYPVLDQVNVRRKRQPHYKASPDQCI